MCGSMKMETRLQLRGGKNFQSGREEKYLLNSSNTSSIKSASLLQSSLLCGVSGATMALSVKREGHRSGNFLNSISMLLQHRLLNNY